MPALWHEMGVNHAIRTCNRNESGVFVVQIGLSISKKTKILQSQMIATDSLKLSFELFVGVCNGFTIL